MKQNLVEWYNDPTPIDPINFLKWWYIVIGFLILIAIVGGLIGL